MAFRVLGAAANADCPRTAAAIERLHKFRTGREQSQVLAARPEDPRLGNPAQMQQVGRAHPFDEARGVGGVEKIAAMPGSSQLRGVGRGHGVYLETARRKMRQALAAYEAPSACDENALFCASHGSKSG